MENQLSIQLASASTLTPDGSGFRVTYLSGS